MNPLEESEWMGVPGKEAAEPENARQDEGGLPEFEGVQEGDEYPLDGGSLPGEAADEGGELQQQGESCSRGEGFRRPREKRTLAYP